MIVREISFIILMDPDLWVVVSVEERARRHGKWQVSNADRRPKKAFDRRRRGEVV